MGGPGDGDEPGLRFDDDSSPDFWIDFTGGGEFGELRHLCELGGLATDGDQGDSGFAGPGGSGAGLAIVADNGIIASIDNSNTGGVTGGFELGDGAGVSTGIEIGIPLEVLGHTEGDRIAVAAFVNGSNHDFVSNQVLGPLGGSDNLGEPRLIDFSTVSGDQFVVVVESERRPVPATSTTMARSTRTSEHFWPLGVCGGCPRTSMATQGQRSRRRIAAGGRGSARSRADKDTGNNNR